MLSDADRSRMILFAALKGRKEKTGLNPEEVYTHCLKDPLFAEVESCAGATQVEKMARVVKMAEATVRTIKGLG